MPLLTPTLAVSDNVDGTGGVATISGGDAGATNEVFVQAIGGIGPSAWTSQGSRVGNGTVNLAVSPGYFWVKVEATAGGEKTLGNVVYASLTGSGESVLFRCLNAVQARIQGLNLSGIPSGNIVVRKLPDDRNISKPAVVIAPFQRETLNPADGTNVRDDIGYPVLVAAMDGDNQHPSSNHNRNLSWRESIRRAFHNQILPGVNEIINTVVEPLPIVDSQAWFERNTFVTAMVLRFTAREPRGTG